MLFLLLNQAVYHEFISFPEEICIFISLLGISLVLLSHKVKPNNPSILTFLFPDISGIFLYLSGPALSSLKPNWHLGFSFVFLVVLFISLLCAVSGPRIPCLPHSCYVLAPLVVEYTFSVLPSFSIPSLSPRSHLLSQLLYVPVGSFVRKLGIRGRYAHHAYNIFLAIEYRSDNDSE